MNFSLPLTAVSRLTTVLFRGNNRLLCCIAFLVTLNFLSLSAGNIVMVKGEIPSSSIEKLSPEDISFWQNIIREQDALLLKALQVAWDPAIQTKEEKNLNLNSGDYAITAGMWSEQLKSNSSAKSFKKWLAASAEPAKQLAADYALRSGKLLLKQKGNGALPEILLSIDLPGAMPDLEDYIFAVKSMKTSLNEKLSGMSEKDRMRAGMVRASKLKDLELIIPDDIVLTAEVAEFSTMYKYKFKVVSLEEYHAAIAATTDQKKAIMMRIPVADGSFRFLAFDPFSGETLAQTSRRPLEEYEEDYVSYLLGKTQMQELSRYIE